MAPIGTIGHGGGFHSNVTCKGSAIRMPVLFGARQEFGPKEEERRQFFSIFVSHAKNDGN